MGSGTSAAASLTRIFFASARLAADLFWHSCSCVCLRSPHLGYCVKPYTEEEDARSTTDGDWIAWAVTSYKSLDGDKSLVLQIDMLTGTPQRLLYSSTIRQWLPPHESDAISSAERPNR